MVSFATCAVMAVFVIARVAMALQAMRFGPSSLRTGSFAKRFLQGSERDWKTVRLYFGHP
jgi:hypothetical protein